MNREDYIINVKKLLNDMEDGFIFKDFSITKNPTVSGSYVDFMYNIKTKNITGGIMCLNKDNVEKHLINFYDSGYDSGLFFKELIEDLVDYFEIVIFKEKLEKDFKEKLQKELKLTDVKIKRTKI